MTATTVCNGNLMMRTFCQGLNRRAVGLLAPWCCELISQLQKERSSPTNERTDKDQALASNRFAAGSGMGGGQVSVFVVVVEQMIMIFRSQ